MNPSVLIRMAMLTGVLMFGGIVFFLRRSGGAPGIAPEQAMAFVWLGRVLWGMAVAGCLVVFQLLQRQAGRKGPPLHIVAWALGEMVALYGGVVWLLAGTPAWYLPGLVYLVLTFLVFRGA